jgi:hypothetical protein
MARTTMTRTPVAAARPRSIATSVVTAAAKPPVEVITAPKPASGTAIVNTLSRPPFTPSEIGASLLTDAPLQQAVAAVSPLHQLFPQSPQALAAAAAAQQAAAAAAAGGSGGGGPSSSPEPISSSQYGPASVPEAMPSSASLPASVVPSSAGGDAPPSSASGAAMVAGGAQGAALAVVPAKRVIPWGRLAIALAVGGGLLWWFFFRRPSKSNPRRRKARRRRRVA